MDLLKIFEWVKPKPKHLFAIVLVSGLLLFLPGSLLDYLALTGLRYDYRAWIGGVFLISIAIWLAQGISVVAHTGVHEFISRCNIRAAKKSLKDLTKDEKAIL